MIFYLNGAVAQLGERLNGIQEVVGSIPISSTSIFIKRRIDQNGLQGKMRMWHKQDGKR